MTATDAALIEALELIRLIMTSLSAKGLPVRLRTCDTLKAFSAQGESGIPKGACHL
jgi:hypothetical protein